MSQVFNRAKALQNEIVGHRRYFHQNPELGLNLPGTVDYVINELKKLGYKPEICAGGVVATCGTGESGKTFLIRGDMDALPISEQSGEPFSSTNGNMHACGHDFHTAMLLGSAKILKEKESEIKGTVKFMFQAAEETIEGAKKMIDEGVLKNPDVDAAMMIHVFTGLPQIEDESIVVLAEGPSTANVDIFRIEVQAKGGHGATPHLTIDPINVMGHIHSALQVINSREVVAKENFTLTIGEFKCGDAHNIIPDSGYMRGTLRSYDRDAREFIKQRIVQISEQMAQLFRANAKVIFESEAPCVDVDPDLRKDVFGYLEKVFDKDVIDPFGVAGGILEKITGSEDFGFVSLEVPSVAIAIIAGTPDKGYAYPPHHPKVKFNEDIAWKGAAIYSIAAMQWLENH